MKEKKTNAARILDSMHIGYKLHTYEVDPDNLAAEHVAELLGEPIERVYKTIVLRGNKTGPIVCVVAGCNEVDLKKAAKVSSNKSVEPLPLKDLLPTTGYIRGGCTALGMKKKFPTFVSEEIVGYDTIFVSAGIRGMQIELTPADYLRATEAVTADIIADK
ncbi:MAG: Cys-tRNA(Pro) deacylase [Muribaculaceae bacterium]|nr:Cys-tRNA(Pro) deacylase [Muribaculaceae bacterium]